MLFQSATQLSAQTSSNNVTDFSADKNVLAPGAWAYGWFGPSRGIGSDDSEFLLFPESYPDEKLNGVANWTPTAKKAETARVVAADGRTYSDASEIAWVYQIPSSLAGEVYVQGSFTGGTSKKKLNLYRATQAQWTSGHLSDLEPVLSSGGGSNPTQPINALIELEESDVIIAAIQDTASPSQWWVPSVLNLELSSEPTAEYLLNAENRQLTTAAGRWTYYTDEAIDFELESSDAPLELAALEIRSLSPEHALFRETSLIGRRRVLSETEQVYLDDAVEQLTTSTEQVIVQAGDDVRAVVPDLDLPPLLQVPLSADGSAHISPMTLPPGVYEVRLPSVSEEDALPIVYTLTVRTKLNHRDYLMRGTDLFSAVPLHRELFQMPVAGINSIQAHFKDNTVGADSLAAMGFEGINCHVLPKADPSWAPAKADGTLGKRQFYNISFNNKDSMQGVSDYVHGPGQAQLLHPFNSTSLTINEVADMVRLDYSDSADAAWTEYLKNTYTNIDELKADWCAENDASITDFESVSMPLPPGGVGGGTFNTHLMMDVDVREAGEVSDTVQPEWIRSAWWHWLKFKDLSMRDWLTHAKAEYDDAGALVSGDKLIHPHHDPGMTFRCNWFLLSQNDDQIFTYDSYNPTWRFGAYFADLASQLHPTPWVLETNILGGPPPEAAAELFSLYAHGLTGVAFFKWQPYKEASYSFGLLEKDWTPGPKFAAVANMYHLAEQTAPSLLHLRSERSPVAVVYPHSDLVQNSSRDWSLLRDWHAFYGAFTDRHMVPHIITEEFADQPIPEWIKVVVLADVTHVGAEVWTRLQQWVNDGGTLLLAGRTGEYDRYGRESSALSEFPGYSIGNRSLPRASVTADSLAANVFRTGEWFVRDGEFQRTAPELLDLEPADDAWNVFRTTNMSNIALMERSFGAGQVVVVPWSPGAMFREEAASAYLRDAWFELLADAGVAPSLTVSPAGRELDAVIRIGDDGRAVFVAGANHGKSGRFSFTVPTPAGALMRAFRFDGAAAEELSLTPSDDGLSVSFELELDTFDPYAVSLFPSDSKPDLRVVAGGANTVQVRGAGIPWTLTVKDSQGLALSRPQHGIGLAEVSWPAYDAAAGEVCVELLTPLGVNQIKFP